jgi:predicted DNA binding CopG/RHH family protein
MKRFKLTKSELAIEKAIERGEYVPVGAEEAARIARAIEACRKEAVLNIRITSRDLKNLKQKAKKLGVPFQTFIGEILHRYAQ